MFKLRQIKRRFARPGEVSVTIGEPVKYSRDDDPAKIARDLHRRVASLN